MNSAKEYARAWCAKNRDKVRASAKAWRDAHPDRVRELQSAWRAKHLDKIRAYAKAWRTAHRDEILAKRRARYHANPMPTILKVRQYRAAQREKREASLRQSLAQVSLTKGVQFRTWGRTSKGRHRTVPMWVADLTFTNKRFQRAFSIHRYGNDGAKLLATLQRMMWLIEHKIWTPADGDPFAVLSATEFYNRDETESGGYSIVDKTQGNWGRPRASDRFGNL